VSTTGKPRLLDQMREVRRLHHYSIHTERAYCAWIRRYVKYHTSGKGDKDRVTTLSTSMIPLLKSHRAKVKTLHKADLAQGHGEIYLPHALARKYPGTGREWG
jgi:Phage integrase, N-terminal SAM-like domain